MKKLLQADIHHFIAKYSMYMGILSERYKLFFLPNRCVDVLVDNMAERAQALRLCRRMLLLDPVSFPVALGRSVVALAFDGTKEKDRLVRASLAILAELCKDLWIIQSQ